MTTEMISPKYASTHYFYSAKTLAASLPVTAPHIVNLYLDYNCPFSARLFLKLRASVIPKLQASHPNQFQFVFVNVIQPWHLNSVFLHEFALVVAKLLKDKPDSNEHFWNVSQTLFENKEKFYDNAVSDKNRNETYKAIADVVFAHTKDLPISEKEVLADLNIKHQSETGSPNNGGNGATNDIKYFTKYLRGVGVHVTPTVSVNGIVNDSVSSGSEVDNLVKVFEALL